MKSTFLVDLKFIDNNKEIIIGFPFSGALAQVFNCFRSYLPENVNLTAVQYPGRGHNISKPLIYHIDEMISALYEPIRRKLFSYNKVYFYGHSLGALIAYELLCHYQKNQVPIDHCCLSIGACPSPELIGQREHFHILPDDEFWQKIQEYGGTPSDILNDEDFKELFLPILKADFTIYETYSYANYSEMPLEAPLITFGGRRDQVVPLKALSNWKKRTTKTFQNFTVNGDHFFMTCLPEFLIQNMLNYTDVTVSN